MIIILRHPVEKTNQRPTDALSREQLAAHNIQIQPTERIGLLVRPTALEREPIFKYAVESSKRFEGRWPQRAVAIILLDTEHLTLDTKVPEAYRDYYESQMREALKQLPPASINGNKPTINGINIGLYFKGPDPEFDLKDKLTGKTLKNEEAKHHVNLIFLPVGGNNRPKLSQSFYGPKDLSGMPTSVITNVDRWREEGLKYLPLMNRNPGFTLRHELKHILGEDELDTDVAAYKDRLEAFLKLMSGDNSYYDMVFDTPEGPVYVNNQSSSYSTA